MKKLPKIVHFRITSFCNNKCVHCFGSVDKPKDLNFSTIKKIIQVVKNGGAEAIHLTGGEPLFRKDFTRIIHFIKKSGLKIILDTSGDFFAKKQKIISKYISVLGLPIDFHNKSFRNKDNLSNVIKILEFYQKKKNEYPKIRILTTLTKINLNELEPIGEILKKYPIDVWRIYQFLPLKDTRAEKNCQKLRISKKQFETATNKIKRKFSRFFKVHLLPLGQRDKAYFIIYPLGEVKISSETKNYQNIEIGSIFDQDTIEKWHQISSKKNFNKNAKEIFELLKK